MQQNGAWTDFPLSIYRRTIIYVMLMMQRPFTGVHSNCVVQQVVTEHQHYLQQLAEGKFYDLVRECWAEKPRQRPSFKELLEEIEQHVSQILPRHSLLNATTQGSTIVDGPLKNYGPRRITLPNPGPHANTNFRGPSAIVDPNSDHTFELTDRAR